MLEAALRVERARIVVREAEARAAGQSYAAKRAVDGEREKDALRGKLRKACRAGFATEWLAAVAQRLLRVEHVAGVEKARRVVLALEDAGHPVEAFQVLCWHFHEHARSLPLGCALLVIVHGLLTARSSRARNPCRRSHRRS